MGVDFNQVGWFEIPTGDIRRAIRFYEGVFDIKLEEHEMGPLQMAWFPMKAGEMGSPGSLVQAKEYTPSADGTLVYFSVADVDATSSKAAAEGGTVLQEKKSIGEHGFIGILQDTEGNRIGIHSSV